MKKIIILIALITFISSYSQEQKIVYRTNGTNIVGWVHKLVDTTNYQLKSNEVFGNAYKKPILDNGIVIEGWTIQDQTTKDSILNELLLDKDISAQKEMKYENDGQELYRKIKNRIRRKLDNSTITLTQFNAIRRTLRPAIIPLTTGDWDITQEYLNAITPPINAKLLLILNNIKGLVDDYINENY